MTSFNPLLFNVAMTYTVVSYPPHQTVGGKTRQDFRLAKDGKVIGPRYSSRKAAQAAADKRNAKAER